MTDNNQLLNIEIKILDHLANNSFFSKDDDLIKYQTKGPSYATSGSVAFDLRAVTDFSVFVYPNKTVKIPSGIAINLNEHNLAAFIIPRSGLGSEKGIVLSNLTGLIDSDYAGEIFITVWNRSDQLYIIKPGDRICQMYLAPAIRANLIPVNQLSVETDRGAGGFGHTGIS